MASIRRNNALVLGATVLALAGAGAFWVLSGGPAAQGPAIPAIPVAKIDVARGKALYAQNCASCHGANLEGQPNWQVANALGIYPAPPHDESGHTWHHDDKLLFDYAKLGGAGVLQQQGVKNVKSGMPAFGGVLSDSEIRDILGYIVSSWPERIKKIRRDRAARIKKN